jgi:hypothetical protein
MLHPLIHEGTDKMNSDFVFHYPIFQALLGCRDYLHLAMPDAFHSSAAQLIEFIQAHQLKVHIPLPVPMAEAWIIVKAAVLAPDYRQDTMFCLKDVKNWNHFDGQVSLELMLTSTSTKLQNTIVALQNMRTYFIRLFVLADPTLSLADPQESFYPQSVS